MKRTRDTDNPEASASRSRMKKTKSIPSCATCRKSKTRCEIIGEITPDTPIHCHRCKVLKTPCSYADMDRSIFQNLVSTPSSSSEHLLRPPPKWTNRLTPPEEFPRPDHIWSFLQTSLSIPLRDWRAPLVAIQELIKPTAQQTSLPLPVIPDESLDHILSKPQVDDLLEVFSAKYLPWLNFSLIRDINNPLLDLVCCMVASRHLDPSMRAMVAPRLQKLTEDTVVKLIFNPRAAESLDSIQSLLILSLWSPIAGSSDSGIKDGRLLIASAVSMAMNLHLNEASANVVSFQTKDPSTIDPTELQDNINRARLWTALTNIESMLCLGSDRAPLSQRESSDTFFIPFTYISPRTIDECRDIRLRHFSELFGSAQKAHRLTNQDDVDDWYDSMSEVLSELDRMQRLMKPLEIVCDYDKQYFHMAMIVYFCCRLLVIYDAMADARRVFNEVAIGSTTWFLEVRPRGITVITEWGKSCLNLCEEVLIATIQSDAAFLATAPDVVFNMIGFAAGMLVGVKFLMLSKLGREMPGCSDALLMRTMEHLPSAALSPDHSAMRCLGVVQLTWDAWMNRHQGQRFERSSPSHYPSTLQVPSSTSPPETLTSQSSPHSHSSSEASPDFSNTNQTSEQWPANPEALQDQDFWTYFFSSVENPNPGTAGYSHHFNT